MRGVQRAVVAGEMDIDAEAGQNVAAARRCRYQRLEGWVQVKERGAERGHVVEINRPGRAGLERVASQNRELADGVLHLAVVRAAPPPVGGVERDGLLIPCVRVQVLQRAAQAILQRLT